MYILSTMPIAGATHVLFIPDLGSLGFTYCSLDKIFKPLGNNVVIRGKFFLLVSYSGVLRVARGEGKQIWTRAINIHTLADYHYPASG